MFSAATKSAAAASPTDPLFDYVTIMLPGNGTNGAQNNTFIDSSSNNFSITRSGNTTQGTFSPYGPNWSNYFDGNLDYLNGGTNSAYDFGSGNFTVEAWVYTYARGSSGSAYAGTWGASGRGWIFLSSATTLSFVYSTNGFNETSITGTYTVALNNWIHLAAVRNGNTITLYANGISIGSGSVTGITFNNATVPIYIGANKQDVDSGINNYQMNGYISNLRIVKGTAVYTSAFTPSTTPLTAISGTSLLTCQSNRFIDNSSNAFAITVNGSPSVQRFSPFSPSASYSTSVVGGSAYFDGSGDYLTAPSNTAFEFGSGAFTVECWVYLNSTASLQPIVTGNAGAVLNWAIYTGSGTITYYLSSTGTGYDIASAVSMGSVTVGQWYHVALVRNGNTFTPYLNGVAGTTTTSAAAIYTANQSVYVGGLTATYYTTGYIANARIVKGTAVYTTAFTPPTSPLTAITNTSLLLNMTNGGIIDNAMMNDWETVTSAQISTAQSKFGGSSIYIPGAAHYITCPVFVPMLGNGNWTIEMWMRSSTTTGSLCGQPGGSGNPWCILFDTGALYFQNNTGLSNTLSNINVGNLLNAAWHHLAIVKNGTTVTCYVDGTSRGTGTDSTNYVSTSTMKIGGTTHSGYSGVTVYVNDFRITRGIARYTANFTPPTTAFPTR